MPMAVAMKESVLCRGRERVGVQAVTSMIPTMAPTMAAAEMQKQKSWRVCSRHHFTDHLGILFCAMCMETGRNTVRGQKPRDPMTPAAAHPHSGRCSRCAADRQALVETRLYDGTI